MNSGAVLIAKIVDEIVDMVVSEYPNNGEIRLALYEQIGENFIAMARVLSKNPERTTDILTKEELLPSTEKPA